MLAFKQSFRVRIVVVKRLFHELLVAHAQKEMTDVTSYISHDLSHMFVKCLFLEQFEKKENVYPDQQ